MLFAGVLGIMLEPCLLKPSCHVAGTGSAEREEKRIGICGLNTKNE